jgi:preprotein translocase subunit SecB
VSSEESPELFHLNFTCVGIFIFDPELTKEQIHVQTYQMLFPVASAFGVTLTANAGIPPLRIVPLDISSSEIYRIDLGGLSGQKPKDEE